MKRTILFFYIILFLLGNVSLAEEEVNLAPNPSFEKGEGEYPEGWIKPAGSSPMRWNRGVSLTGNCSLEVSSGKGSAFWYTENLIPINPKKYYIFSGWIKTINSWGGNCLCIAWFDKSLKWINSSFSHRVEGTKDWEFVFVRAKPPKNAKAARLYVGRRWSSSGKTWFDEVNFKESKNGMEAFNLSFEEGILGRVKSWRFNQGTSKTGKGVWDNTIAHTGKASVKIYDCGKGYCAWESLPFRVKENKWYILSGWLKSKKEEGYTRIMVAWFDEKKWICNSDVSDQISGTTDWIRVEKGFRAPKNAVRATICCRTENCKGTVWFDDINFEPAEAPEILEHYFKKGVLNLSCSEWIPTDPFMEAAVDDETVFHGLPSLRIGKCRRGNGWVSKGYIPIEPNKEYEFSGYIKLYHAWGDNLLAIKWYTEDMRILKTSWSVAVNGWCNFRLISLIDKAPLKASYARLFCLVKYGHVRGFAWFNNLNFGLGPVERKIKEKNNLVKNSSIEEVTKEGNPIFWSKSQQDNGELCVAKGISYTGERSLQIANTSNKEVGWISSPILVTPLTKYRFSAFCRLQRAYNVQLAIKWLDKNGKEINTTYSPREGGTANWKLVFFDVKAPANAHYACLLCIQNRSSGTSWFDNISFKKINP